MENQPILILGATGQQGGAAAKALLKQNQPVRAASRSQEKLEALKSRGAETAVCDLSDPESLKKALQGVKRAFLVTTPFEKGTDAEVEQGINFIDAAGEAGVEHIVFTSVAASNKNTGIPHFESKFKVENHLIQSQIPYTILRPVFFMENFGSALFLPMIQEGTFSLPVSPNTQMQMISLDVIGAFAAQAFLKPSTYIGKSLDLASDALTFPDAMNLISKASGKNITYEKLPKVEAAEIYGPDLGKMLNWFDDAGYDIDIEALKKHGIHMTPFEEHLRKAEWIKSI